VDYFERRGLPFVVAINVFDSSPAYDLDDVRIALDLDPEIPVLLCDARQRASAKQVLITLVEHVLTRSAPGGGDGERVPAHGNGEETTGHGTGKPAAARDSGERPAPAAPARS
jgi:hypothetical protein